MKHPFYRAGGNSLVWDSDLNPEGIAASVTAERFFGNVGVLVVEEDAADRDVFIYSAQAGVKLEMNSSSTFSAGLGIFDFTHVAGAEPFYDGKPRGNSVDLDGLYLQDFSILEMFAEY